MLAIIDACSVMNLINSSRSIRFIDHLKRTFEHIYISQKVYDEVINKKIEYLDHYDDKNHLEEIYHSAKLHELINGEENSKCLKTLNEFIKYKNFSLKQNGEYYSTHLSLLYSRDGDKKLNENLLSVVFITDDYKHEKLYNNFFKINSIGQIIDSIDFISILYVKEVITKSDFRKMISAYISLYNRDIYKLKKYLEGLSKFNSLDSKEMSCISYLMTNLLDAQISIVLETLHDRNYKKLYKKNKKLKTLINSIGFRKLREKIPYLKERIKLLDQNMIFVN